MDTVSLLISRRAHDAGSWLAVAGMIALGVVVLALLVLAIAAPGSDIGFPQRHADPLLAPFRWYPVRGHIA